MQLKNHDLTIALNEKGAIQKIVDRKLNRSYLEVEQFLNLFRLCVPSPQWDGRYADSNSSQADFAQEEDGNVLGTFQNFIAADGKSLDITATVCYFLEGRKLKLSIQVENHSGFTISQVLFPMLSGFADKGKTMRMYAPEQAFLTQDRIWDPFDTGNKNHKGWTRNNNRHDVRYPQLLSTAWLDYSDQAGGISIEQRSQAFDICDFGVEHLIRKDSSHAKSNLRSLQIALQSSPNIESGETWESPEFVIYVHEGGWHEAAASHREWLRTIVKTPESSPEFESSLGWHFYFMKQQDGTVFHDYNDLPKMAKAALDAGIHYIMVFGWFQAGHDNAYPFGYYANHDWGGEKVLQEKLAECEAMGCHVIPFFNGTLLDISRKEYEATAKKWPAVGRVGKPYCGTDFSRTNFNLGFRNAMLDTTDRNMTLLDICITAPEVQKWWKETVTRIVHEYGFHNLQLDQIAHKSYVCYAPDHHHEKPQFAYTKELAGLLTEVRQIVKKENPGGVMIGEGCSDLCGQFMDGFWNWNQLHNHPEILRYSAPWLNYSHELDANEYEEANRCFAEKILMDLKIEGGDGCLADYPSFTRHLRELSKLKVLLKDTYIRGEYRHLDGIRRMEKRKDVLLRSYENPAASKRCVIVANLTDQVTRAEFELELMPQSVAIAGTKLGRAVLSPSQLMAFSLRPYEVMAVEYQV